jgi:uncharacterized protein (TIGR03067 family)
MKKLFACIVCLSLSTLVAVNAGDKKKQDAPKLEGVWTGVTGISDGKKVPDDIVSKLTLTIKEGKYNVTFMDKEVETGSYKVDASKKPAHLDLTIAKGKDEGKVQPGIVMIEGDMMTVALGKAGTKDRPKKFEGADGVEVTKLKRAK